MHSFRRLFSQIFSLLLLFSPISALFQNEDERQRWMAEKHEEGKEHIRRVLRENARVDILVHYKPSCGNPYHDFVMTRAHPMTVTEQEYEGMLKSMDDPDSCYEMIQLDGTVTEDTFVTGANDEDMAEYQLAETELAPWGLGVVLGQNFPPPYAPPGISKLCFCDSGVLPNHSDLEYRSINGQSFVDGAAWDLPNSRSGHGMQVTGVACAAENGMGTKGVAKCKYIDLGVGRVFGDGPGATTTTSKIDRCLEWSVSEQCNVINMSLSTTTRSANMELILEQIEKEDKIVVIGAAGNRGPSGETAYPASFDGVISVGAVDSNKKAAEFSQRNPNVVAPGVKVLTTSVGSGFQFPDKALSGKPASIVFPFTETTETTTGTVCHVGCTESMSDPAPCDGSKDAIWVVHLCSGMTKSLTDHLKDCDNSSSCVGVLVTSPDDALLYENVDFDFKMTRTIPILQVKPNYLNDLARGRTVEMGFRLHIFTFADGTSQAAPYVAGIAAMLMAYMPQCSASQVKNAIESSAVPLSGDQSLTGKGLVNAEKAYLALQNEPMPCGNAMPANVPEKRESDTSAKDKYKTNPSDFLKCTGSYRSRGGCRNLRGTE